MATNTLSLYDYEPTTGSFFHDVVEGLQSTPKTLPCKYLYDERGSRIFDRICELDEYYPTRTEMAILRDSVDELAREAGEGCTIIEYGSGSSQKVRLLLDAFHEPKRYVPIDISKQYLVACAEALQSEFPDLEVIPICTDYTTPIALPEEIEREQPRLVFFPGSTIGNFEPEQLPPLLRSMREAAGRDGKILVGVDLIKDPGILHEAYNDAKGVTAEFNLNLLRRINRELDANFQLDRFEHLAVYNEQKQRIEMQLISVTGQTARVGDRAFQFEAGESIFTESSYKYSLDTFARIVETEGLEVKQVWRDDAGLFSEQLLTVVD